MTGLVLGLVLGCTLAWSMLDILRKRLARELSAFALIFALTLGQVPVLGLWAAGRPWGETGWDYWLPTFGVIGLNLVANVAFVRAVHLSPLGVTIPLLSLTPALTCLLAIPLLGEIPTQRHVVGIALVVGGAFLLAVQRGTGSFWRRFLHEPGVPLMVLVAACWSLSLPFDKIALAHLDPLWHAVVISAGTCLGTLVVLLSRTSRPGFELTPSGRLALLVAVLVAAAALGLQMLAVRLVPVGLLEAVKRAGGNLFALAFGALFFQERIERGQVIAVVVLVVGVTLLL